MPTLRAASPGPTLERHSLSSGDEPPVMFRASVFACGMFVALCGSALCGIDRLILTEYAGGRLRRVAEEAASGEPAAWRLIYADAAPADGPLVVDPPDWAAFCLLSVGGVTLLYAVCLPGRRPEEPDEE